MSTKVKAAWVDALRSGYYKQGKYKLRDLGDYYDPTGVLCDLAVREGVIDEPKKNDDPDGLFFGYTYYDPEVKFWLATGLPRPVQAWSGVSYRAGYRLALLGDNGVGFDKIADLIGEL